MRTTLAHGRKLPKVRRKLVRTASVSKANANRVLQISKHSCCSLGSRTASPFPSTGCGASANQLEQSHAAAEACAMCQARTIYNTHHCYPNFPFLSLFSFSFTQPRQGFPSSDLLQWGSRCYLDIMYRMSRALPQEQEKST